MPPHSAANLKGPVHGHTCFFLSGPPPSRGTPRSTHLARFHCLSRLAGRPGDRGGAVHHQAGGDDELAQRQVRPRPQWLDDHRHRRSAGDLSQRHRFDLETAHRRRPVAVLQGGGRPQRAVPGRPERLDERRHAGGSEHLRRDRQSALDTGEHRPVLPASRQAQQQVPQRQRELGSVGRGPHPVALHGR